MLNLLLVPLALSSTVPQGPAASLEAPAQRVVRSVQILPTAGLLHVLSSAPAPTFGLQNGDPRPQARTDLLGAHEDHGTCFSADLLIELLRSGLGSPAADPNLNIELIGQRLLVSGPPDLVELTKKRLTALGEQVARPIQVSVEIYALGDKTPPVPAVLAPEQVAEATRGLNLLWRSNGGARPGARTLLAMTRRIRYVQSIGVEVAQKAHCSDPLMTELEVGPALTVEPHLLANGSDLVLFAQFKHAELVGEIATRATGSTDHPTIDTPVLRSCSGGFSGRIADGGALTVTLGGEGEFQRLVVLRASSGGPARDLDKLGFFPTSALTSRALTQALEHLSAFPEGEGSLALTETNAGFLEPDVLNNLLAASFEGNQFPSGVHVSEHFVTTSPDSDAGRKISAQLRLLEDQLLRNAQLEVTLSHVADPDQARGRSSGNLPRGLRAPALLGHTHPWILGTESRALCDFRVEIAQEATTSAPVVVTLFRGFTLNAQAIERSQGAPGLHASLTVTNHAEPATRALGGPAGGDLQRTDVESAVFSITSLGSHASAAECGDGPRMDLLGRPGICRPTLTLTELGKPAGR